MTRINMSVNLLPMKEKAYVEIDQATGNMRLMFISNIPGQDMVYMAKEQEAVLISERLAANASASFYEHEIPHLYIEANRHGVSFLDKASEVLTKAHEWRAVSALLDDMRLEAKERVAAATSPAQIDTAKTIDWSIIYQLIS